MAAGKNLRTKQLQKYIGSTGLTVQGHVRNELSRNTGSSNLPEFFYGSEGDV